VVAAVTTEGAGQKLPMIAAGADVTVRAPAQPTMSIAGADVLVRPPADPTIERAVGGRWRAATPTGSDLEQVL